MAGWPGGWVALDQLERRLFLKHVWYYLGAPFLPKMAFFSFAPETNGAPLRKTAFGQRMAFFVVRRSRAKQPISKAVYDEFGFAGAKKKPRQGKGPRFKNSAGSPALSAPKSDCLHLKAHLDSCGRVGGTGCKLSSKLLRFHGRQNAS